MLAGSKKCADFDVIGVPDAYELPQTSAACEHVHFPWDMPEGVEGTLLQPICEFLRDNAIQAPSSPFLQ